MAKRILYIDDEAREKVEKILAYAEDHRYDPYDKSEGAENRIPGRDPNLQCMLFDGYRCVFSYTLGPSRGIYYRHLSISVDNRFDGSPNPKVRQDYPSPPAVMTIAKLFGFTGEPTKSHPIPADWMLDINKGNEIDDPCIVVAQEKK